MFANTQMMGMDFAFPDVCLTPSPAGPVPIPYPNIAMGPTAIPNCAHGASLAVRRPTTWQRPFRCPTATTPDWPPASLRAW
jgi:hypothetical protein